MPAIMEYFRGKYVVLEKNDSEYMIVLPTTQNHNSVQPDASEKIVSAGFISIVYESQGKVIVRCNGESVTLKVGSRGDVDAELAKKVFDGYSY